MTYEEYDEREERRESEMPHSSEAESTLLGNIFLNNDLIAEASEILKPDDFYVPNHRVTFGAMVRLFEIGLEIHPVMIDEQLRKEGSSLIPGVYFLSNLLVGVNLVHSIATYANLIKEKSMLRLLHKTGLKIAAEALDGEEEPYYVLDRATKAVFDITVAETKPGFTRIDAIAHRNLQKTYQIQQSGSGVTGLTTGFVDLDSITLGLQNGDLILVAARPSIGKTAFSLMIAENAAIGANATVAFFSLEMPDEPLGYRVLCAQARVDSQRLRSGYLNPQEWDRLHEVEQLLNDKKLYINDSAGISVLGIRAKARRLQVEVGALNLIVVDYLQLMAGSDKRFESRQQEVSLISRELKGLAKELNVPLVALSQLSRAPENRADHRPTLADLRESGALEQDADVVIGLYDEDAYKAKSDHEATLTNTMEAIILKHRNGPTGTVALRFDKRNGRFDNLYDA